MRDGADHALTRKELFEAFLAVPTSDGPAAEGTRPWWARDTDAAVTVESLRRVVPNQAALVGELARLRLIDAQPEHTRAKNAHRVVRARAVETAGGIAGTDEVERLLGEFERAA